LVVADPPEALLPELVASQGHQVLQLHGDESPERCRQLRHRLAPHGQGLQLWKALRIRTAADLEQVGAYSDSVDAVLLDAWSAAALGGTGQRIPLPWLQRFTAPMPWWLAGGIGPANAADVLSQLQPHGLDASSELEVSPGIKDLERVRQLLAVIQAARQDRSH
jgi:phosphoribosylanthranilate isomerase